MGSDSRNAVEKVLAAHIPWTNAEDGCLGCGWVPDSPDYAGVKHREHVAEAIVEVLARRTPATLRDELRRASEQRQERPAWTKRRMPTITGRDE